MEMDDYQNDPEGDWCRVEYAHDRESAAQIFVEEDADPFGRFGKGESDRREIAVLVWDEAEGKPFLVSVMPEPKPGYFCEELSPDEISDMGFELEEVKEPDYAQISQ